MCPQSAGHAPVSFFSKDMGNANRLGGQGHLVGLVGDPPKECLDEWGAGPLFG